MEAWQTHPNPAPFRVLARPARSVFRGYQSLRSFAIFAVPTRCAFALEALANRYGERLSRSRDRVMRLAFGTERARRTNRMAEPSATTANPAMPTQRTPGTETRPEGIADAVWAGLGPSGVGSGAVGAAGAGGLMIAAAGVAAVVAGDLWGRARWSPTRRG